MPDGRASIQRNEKVVRCTWVLGTNENGGRRYILVDFFLFVNAELAGAHVNEKEETAAAMRS